MKAKLQIRITTMIIVIIALSLSVHAQAPPAPWQSAGVGDTAPGSTVYTAGTGTFTINGGGPDIGNEADGFRFVYQPIVGNAEIIVQGKKVADVEKLLESEDINISELAEELAYHAAKRPELDEEEEEKGRSVTVMGDKDVPYQLLKRVMTTCAKADFRDISLAVNKLETPEPDPATLQSLTEQES